MKSLGHLQVFCSSCSHLLAPSTSGCPSDSWKYYCWYLRAAVQYFDILHMHRRKRWEHILPCTSLSPSPPSTKSKDILMNRARSCLTQLGGIVIRWSCRGARIMIQILAAASRRRVTAKDGASRTRLFLIAQGPPRADRPYESRNLVNSRQKSINLGLENFE